MDEPLNDPDRLADDPPVKDVDEDDNPAVVPADVLGAGG